MSQRNPLYQAMLRTRLIHTMMRNWQASGGTKAISDQFGNEMAVLHGLHDRDAISFSELRSLSAKAARYYHAQAIKHCRRQMTRIDRRRLTPLLREAVHPHSGFAL